MTPAARAIGESARWVATLSLDDPGNVYRPWRWFVAASWQESAAMCALDTGGTGEHATSPA